MPEEKIVSPESLSGQIEKTKEKLAHKFGIENLTTIEGVHLRKIVEQAIKERVRDKKELLKHEELLESATDKKQRHSLHNKIAHSMLAHMFNVSSESAARWLSELYDINPENIPEYCEMTDLDTGEKYRYNVNWGPNKDRIGSKVSELEGLGHKIKMSYLDIPEDFKKYIGILRERAHNP